MVTREDLESFLIRMDLDWNEVDEGMFLVQSPSGGVSSTSPIPCCWCV